MDDQNHFSEKMTDKNKKVLFDTKIPLHKTTFHQIKKDITSFVSDNSNEMIADIGCPNSVIGLKDVSNFKRGLSNFQHQNMKVLKVNENFKFGPSGPYNSSQKIRFPIRNGFWAEVAIVNANIPMLLGNNILKPLEAEIKLFSSGNGILKLKETEIKLKETSGGHYTIKVSDLSKLCGNSDEGITFWTSQSQSINIQTPKYFPCDQCRNLFKTEKSLKDHKVRKHDPEKFEQFECKTCGRIFFDEDCFQYHIGNQSCNSHVRVKSALKNSTLKEPLEQEYGFNQIITGLNTQLNGNCSKREKTLMLIIKNLAQLQQDGCQLKGDAHQAKHEGSDRIESIFLSHHDEENDDEEIELNQTGWNILFSEEDESELTKKEEREILKLHRYFAHRNGQKLWENLFQPAGKLKGKKKHVLKFLEKCEVCRKYKRTPSRPKVGLPKAKDVNDVVSIDLKILKKSKGKEIGILYIHDEFSKLIKGQVINDKQKDTIIKGLENKWIIGDGAGPGHPIRGFFSDNGGEFLNDDVIDFAAALDITIKMTAASSPWMNGSCERAHATVDRIVEKILEDDSKISLQEAVDLACFVKNTEINKTGFSPLQLFCGRSPGFPGLSDCTPGSIELEGNNEYLKVLRRLDQARVMARKIDCDQRMKIALKSKINTSNEKRYSTGDSIWFKLESSHKWKSGIVLAQDGKVIFVKYGNFLRRVPLDFIVPADEYHDDEIDTEPDKNDIDNSERLQDDTFENVEIVVQKEKEIDQLKRSNLEQEIHIKQLERKVSDESNPLKSRSSSHVTPYIPKQWQRIRFKEAGKTEFLQGKVVRKQKKSSVHKNILGIQLDDGMVKDYDFSKDIDDWCDAKDISDEMDEICCLYCLSDQKDILHENFVTILTRAQMEERPDAKKVMKQEIKKFADFGAIKTVNDEGQYAIKTRWVFTEHEDESKGYKLKARLCMRGDREENTDSIRVDSPTTHKDSLKLALAISANEDFEPISGDIKSAFLQGKSLDREVYVVPPKEANLERKLWLLEKGAYGLLDGSRLFYLEMKDKLEKIGMKQVSGDPALFTFHVDGKLIGLVLIHVDDLLMSGNEKFHQIVKSKLFKLFQFSKVEMNKFKYLGCKIEKLTNGDITLNQDEYIQKIQEVEVPTKRNSYKVNENERKEIRRVVGELLWVSLMTRPDLSFEVNQLSSKISEATIKELKEAKRLVEKAKLEPITVNFTKLGPKEDLKIKLFCDASYNNQDSKLRSTEGRVLLLENKKSRKSNIFAWKTKKISRICRSVKGAETRALENGLDEAVHFARMVREIYDGKVNLKSPKQIDVEAATDNKGLWENLNNTRQCDEKLLRNSIALVKEMMEKSEVKKIEWVETKEMLADTLTKKSGNGTWIKEVISRNIV